MDYLMGGFADAHLPTLSEDDLAAFEALLELPDRDVLMWLTGEASIPEEWATPLFAKLKTFHTHSAPIHV